MSDTTATPPEAAAPKFLSRAELLAAGTAKERFRPVPFPCPALGGSVHLRKLDAGELVEYQVALRECEEKQAYAVMFAHAVGDAQGRREFLDADVRDLLKFDPAEMLPVIAEFKAVNGLASKA